jgi:hypothetical protein
MTDSWHKTTQTKEVNAGTPSEDKQFLTEYVITTMCQLSKEQGRLWKANALGVRNGLLVM